MGNIVSPLSCHTCDQELPGSSGDYDAKLDRLVDKVEVTVYTPKDGSRQYYKIKQIDPNPYSLFMEAAAALARRKIGFTDPEIMPPLGLLRPYGLADLQICGVRASLYFETDKIYCYECFFKPKWEEEKRRRIDKHGFDEELIDKKAVCLEYLEWLNELKGYSYPYLQSFKIPSLPDKSKNSANSFSMTTKPKTAPDVEKPECPKHTPPAMSECLESSNISTRDVSSVLHPETMSITSKQSDKKELTPKKQDQIKQNDASSEKDIPRNHRTQSSTDQEDVQQLQDKDEPAGVSSEDSEEDLLWSSDEDLSSSDDDFDWEEALSEGDESEGIGYDQTSTKQLIELLDEIIMVQPSQDRVCDRDLQTNLQICLLSCYSSVLDLSNVELDALVSELADVSLELSNIDLFALSKALSLLCKEILQNLSTSSVPNDCDDTTDQFFYDLTLTASKSSICSKGCLEACLGEFISCKLKCTSVLKNALLTTVTTSLWSTQDVMHLLKNKALVNDEKKCLDIVQLALINQIGFKHIKCVLDNNSSAWIDTLQHCITEENSDKSVEKIVTALAETKLFDSNTLLRVSKIADSLHQILYEQNTFAEYKMLGSVQLKRHMSQVFILGNPSNQEMVSALKLLCCGVKEHSLKNYFPTAAQLVALCILILSHQSGQNNLQTNRLLQVFSGEGKSTIIAMFAAFLGLQGNKVDVVTSSLELAQRDSADWKEFFKQFNLSSAHNTETEELLEMRQEQADKHRVKIYEEHDVVYGTVSSFSADYLRQAFEMRTLRPKRPYQVAIVDEVDMLMLDEGVQFTYLSHQAPVLRHIEPVLALVWTSVSQNTPFVMSTGDTLFAGVPKFIHNIIFEGINRALCGGFSDSRQLLRVAVQEKIIDQEMLDVISQAKNIESQQAAMEAFTTDNMIQLVSCLQDGYLPYRFKVFVLNSIGELEEEFLSEPSPSDIKRPEFSLLVMDKGSACPLYEQEKLSVAVQKIVSNQCDLQSHNTTPFSNLLRADDGQRYFEGVSGYFHDIIYSVIMKKLKLKFETSEVILNQAVAYGLMLESDVTQLLYAKDSQAKKSVMEKLASFQLSKFIKKLNNDLPFVILPYTLSEGVHMLVPAFNIEDVLLSVNNLTIPVLVKGKGLVCPLYPYKWMVESSDLALHAPDGTCYWLGEPAFFHETIFQLLSSRQILFTAVRMKLLEEMDVKLFLQAKDRASKQSALKKCTKGEIATLLSCIKVVKNVKIFLYTKDSFSLEQVSKETMPNSNDPKLLFKEKGMLSQLHLKQTVEIPEFMKEFVSNQLPTYIQSAFTALFMTEEREYLVTDHAEKREIVPIDFQNTGVIEQNKRWGGGLQQMLEMKHFLELSPITVITNFISHIGFFKLYGALYGLSGTIGLKQEQEILRDDTMYKLHSCCIPTSKKRRFYECKEVIVQGSREDWKNEIFLKLQEVTGKESKRAALILCEDMLTAKEIEQFLDAQKHLKQITTYYGPGNREHVNSNTFVSGDIIVATNLAGRGTDIKVSQEVNDCGGLFCLVTFLPRNERVEMQAFGRTARCGNPGSAQLLLLASSLPREYQYIDMKTIRELRAQQETKRLTSMVEHDVKEVMLREELFAKHCQYIHRVRDHFRKDKNVSVVIESINEEWGQWLQTKQSILASDQERESLITDLERIHSKWDSSLQMQRNRKRVDMPILPGGNFIHLIKLANQLAKSGHQGQKDAIKLYRKAIDVEKQYTPGHQSRYTAIAYYNHAYCEINVYGNKDDQTGDEKTQICPFISKAKDLLQTYVDETNIVLQCVKSGRYKQDKLKREKSDFAKQMDVRVQLLEFVSKKISNSLQELEQLKKSGEHSIKAVPSSVFQLIPNPDIAAEEELLGLSQLGLEFVFDVKKKPRFCWEGLVVFVLGIAEITVGVCLTVFTAGIGSEIGMGLIAEGVSDCIDGTIGMITGEWSWSQWATMKACSIAVSLATGGVGKFVEIAEEGVEVAKIGTKALPKLAEEGTEEVTKVTLKDACKDVAKEFVKQGVMRGLGEVENKALNKIAYKIAEYVTVHGGIGKLLENDFSDENPLGRVVDQRFASRLPPGYRVEDKMSPVLEKEAIDFFNEVVNSVVTSLVSHSETFGTVMQTLSDLIHGISGKLKGRGAPLFHLLEGSLVLVAIGKAESNLQNLFVHFKDNLEQYLKVPSQAEHVKKMNEFLPKQCAFAAGEAMTSELLESIAKLVKHPLDEEQNKVLTTVIDDLAEKTSAYLEADLRKSFSCDQNLYKIVSVVFVVPHAVKSKRNISASLPSFKQAATYFQTVVHEVVVGLLNKDTDFNDVVHSVLNLLSKSPIEIPAEVTTEYVSKLKHVIDCVPSHLFAQCEKYVNSVQEPCQHIQTLTKHVAHSKVHAKLYTHCQQFFKGSKLIMTHETSDLKDIKGLKCVVALKKKLAEQTVKTFTEAVASVLLQNLGWIANQVLNRTVNDAIAYHISEPRKTLQAARDTARYVGNALHSIGSIKMTPYKVEYRGKSLFSSTEPISEAELKVAANLQSQQIELTDRFGHKRIIEPLSKDTPAEELPKVSLIEDEEGKYSLADDSEHNRYELLEALTHGLNQSKLPEHHLDRLQLQQAIAKEIQKSPTKWTQHYETERQRADLKPHRAKILDPKSFGTKFEAKVVEQAFKVGITIVDKEGKVLRQSKRNYKEQITLVYIKDAEHPKGHYDRLVDGEHVAVHSEYYGNCYYDAISEEINHLRKTQLDGDSVRRAVADEIAKNPRKWHKEYIDKRKLERSWMKKSHLLKGGARRIQKEYVGNFELYLKTKRGKYRTAMLRAPDYWRKIETRRRWKQVDHIVELQQFVHEMNHLKDVYLPPRAMCALIDLANSKINLQGLGADGNLRKSHYISRALKLKSYETSLGKKYKKNIMISVLEKSERQLKILQKTVEEQQYPKSVGLIVNRMLNTVTRRLVQVRKM